MFKKKIMENHVHFHVDPTHFKSHLFKRFKMIFPVYHVTLALPGESAEIASHIWKILVLAPTVVGKCALNRYFFGHDKAYYMSTWTHDCWLFRLVFPAYFKNKDHLNIIFQYDLMLKKSRHDTSSFFELHHVDGTVPPAVVPAKAACDPDAILRASW